MAIKQKRVTTKKTATVELTKSASGNSGGSGIEPAKGKLGVMIPGMGAVATTFVAGVEAIRKGIAKPIGSLTQMGTIRLGKRTEGRSPKIKEFVPLAELERSCLHRLGHFRRQHVRRGDEGRRARTLPLDQIKPFLQSIKPRKAVFDHNYVKKLDGTNVKKGKNKMDLAEQFRDDIRRFKKTSGAIAAGDDLVRIDGDLSSADRSASVGQSIREGVAAERREHCAVDDLCVRVADGRRAVRQRRAEPDGRYSGHARVVAAERSSHLRQRLQDRADADEDHSCARVQSPHAGAERMVFDQHPGQPRWGSAGRSGVIQDQGRVEAVGAGAHSAAGALSGAVWEFYHKVRINYYPPRGDNKEGWDNIDIFGWLGYPMQIKVDFLCRDSILAAPIVLDLVLFLDLASAAQNCAGMGIQEWMSFYFKSPMTAPGLYPEHDLFIQSMKLKNTLRHLRGEELITHLGLEYYD